LSFPLKLDLAVALDLLHRGEKQGFLAVNALRNKFAHNSNIATAEASEADVKILFNALPKVLRQMWQKQESEKDARSDTREKLRWILTNLFIRLGIP